jgi:hypothetical protein
VAERSSGSIETSISRPGGGAGCWACYSGGSSGVDRSSRCEILFGPRNSDEARRLADFGLSHRIDLRGTLAEVRADASVRRDLIKARSATEGVVGPEPDDDGWN